MHVVQTLTKPYRNSNTLVVADSAFESMQIMEWGKMPENMIAFVMSYGGNKKCHPSYFRTKQSNIWKHFKDKEKRGACLQTHSDTVTFTMVKDSSNFRLVDNDLDYDTLTPRVVKRFNKNKKGDERWKGLSKVILDWFKPTI